MGQAHRQAWCWQDEWFGLTMEDIRRLERETQALLEKKFGNTVDDSPQRSVSIGEVTICYMLHVR